MDKRYLEECLAKGMSLEAIGREVGKDRSTVGYWIRKHGLRAVNSARHSSKGGLTRESLEPLVVEGLTIREIAQRLGRSGRTIAYWLEKHDLQTNPALRRRRVAEARLKGERRLILECPRHGPTTHALEGRERGVRCLKCRSEGVSEWRRRTKLLLISEAGGHCAICGYSRCPAALQFHHLDPSAKEFGLALRGVTRSIEKIRVEAKKCVLLCGNCHAEVEAGVAELPVKWAADPTPL